MSEKVKHMGIVAADFCLAAYIVLAFSAFRTKREDGAVCPGISVVIADGRTHGFVDKQEVLQRVKKAGLDPKGKPAGAISCREMEEALLATPFIRTAQCYTTINGIVNIEVTQRMPVVRIKSDAGDDFYLDDKDCIMPISNFTSDIIIATGSISRTYATNFLAPMARALAGDDFSRNLFQQINVTREEKVELIPQVGGNVILLGRLPGARDKAERDGKIEEYVGRKMEKLRTFYKYGLSVVGWSTYSVIDLEYDNQIVCKRRKAGRGTQTSTT